MSDWFTFDLERVDWIRTAILVLAIVAIYVALMQHLMPEIRTITTKEFHRVPVIKEVERVKMVRVACPQGGVAVLDTKEVAEKLDLPWLSGGDIAAAKVAEGKEVPSPSSEGTSPAEPATASQTTASAEPQTYYPGPDDETKGPPVPGNPADLRVAATAELPESPNGYDVLAIYNTSSGIITPTAKEKDAPWLELRNNFGAGVRGGVEFGKVAPGYTGTLYGFWEFLRVRNAYLTTYGELSTDGVGKVQGDLQWRFR